MMGTSICQYELTAYYPEDYYGRDVPIGRKKVEFHGERNRHEQAADIVDRTFPRAKGEFVLRLIRKGEQLLPNSPGSKQEEILENGTKITEIGLDPRRGS
ncbi:hypothetical protein COU91_00600 [Candidatus Saccharibacteria bacterium CG10_big_fil_rev_8_21_14_0_10_47_8]|nr:MAG: hypothetical protein COU91_00600 [Candidatus Saccharibacteria bacterium CG10_big_fil_rev_8_21_14_0_10_47_8]